MTGDLMSQEHWSEISFVNRVQEGSWLMSGSSIGNMYGIHVNHVKLGPCDKKTIVFITGISVIINEDESIKDIWSVPI